MEETLEIGGDTMLLLDTEVAVFFLQVFAVLVILALIVQRKQGGGEEKQSDFLPGEKREELSVDAFMPPAGDGYLYYASKQSVFYILRRRTGHRIYVVNGPFPADVKLEKDRYGVFFTTGLKNEQTIEQILDHLCGGGR